MKPKKKRVSRKIKKENRKIEVEFGLFPDPIPCVMCGELMIMEESKNDKCELICFGCSSNYLDHGYWMTDEEVKIRGL